MLKNRLYVLTPATARDVITPEQAQLIIESGGQLGTGRRKPTQVGGICEKGNEASVIFIPYTQNCGCTIYLKTKNEKCSATF